MDSLKDVVPVLAVIAPYASAVVSGLVVGFLVPRTNARQFYRQRWWEEKKAAYQGIMDSLACLQRCLILWLDDALEGHQLREDRAAELGKSYRQAMEVVERMAAVGAYVISEDACGSLEQLIQHLRSNEYALRGDELGDYEWSLKTVRECVRTMRGYLKADLGIAEGRPWYRRMLRKA